MECCELLYNYYLMTLGVCGEAKERASIHLSTALFRGLEYVPCVTPCHHLCMHLLYGSASREPIGMAAAGSRHGLLGERSNQKEREPYNMLFMLRYLYK